MLTGRAEEFCGSLRVILRERRDALVEEGAVVPLGGLGWGRRGARGKAECEKSEGHAAGTNLGAPLFRLTTLQRHRRNRKPWGSSSLGAALHYTRSSIRDEPIDGADRLLTT